MRVRLFAGLREAMGWAEQQVAAQAAATPLTIWQELDLGGAWLAAINAPAGAARPATDDTLPDGVRVAINQQFTEAHIPLADGDELAFLPPISGG